MEDDFHFLETYGLCGAASQGLAVNGIQFFMVTSSRRFIEERVVTERCSSQNVWKGGLSSPI
jgi:hypothetical protein